jgi:hypothetical protein
MNRKITAVSDKLIKAVLMFICDVQVNQGG